MRKPTLLTPKFIAPCTVLVCALSIFFLQGCASVGANIGVSVPIGRMGGVGVSVGSGGSVSVGVGLGGKGGLISVGTTHQIPKSSEPKTTDTSDKTVDEAN